MPLCTLTALGYCSSRAQVRQIAQCFGQNGHIPQFDKIFSNILLFMN